MPKGDHAPETTESGIEIGYRYESIHDIPQDVRPLVSAKRLSDYPKGRPGVRGPGARMGRDRRTYWCLTCETAVRRPTTTWCDRCEKDRNNDSRALTRREEAGLPTELTFPVTLLEDLVALADAVVDRIGDATMEFDRPHMEGGAIDELMRATKDLARFLIDEIRPAVKNTEFRSLTVEEVKARRAGRHS